jgi:hypothetical protein
VKEATVPRQGVLFIPLAPRSPGVAPSGRGAALIPFLMLLVSSAAESQAAVSGIERFTLANGLSVTIYSADHLLEELTTVDGEPAIRLDDERVIPVLTDIADPSIVNKGDGRFHPFPLELVVSSLEALEHPSMGVSVTIYLLPFPRRGVMASSTVGAEVFLSPHVLPIDRTSAAYIIAHEMGHAFHNAFLGEDSEKWERYRRLRGIGDESRFSADASHPYRPQEIFAEDFRVLFGGPDAHFGGHVENPELPNPAFVRGLSYFFTRVTVDGVVQSFFERALP